MFKYELKLNDVTTHSIFSKEDIENPWNLDKLKNWGYNGQNHTITKTDISEEVAAINQKRQQKLQALENLRAMDVDSATTKQVLKELVKALID